jgi:hypothetical protein
VPTTRPRYTVTDTGEMADMLDLAQRRWPEITDRRVLLLKLAEAGHAAIVEGVAAGDHARRREAQRAAVARAASLVDEQVLLSDAAWT